MLKETCVKKLKELKKKDPEAYIVIVMRYFPWWSRGVKKRYNEWARILAPSAELLKRYLIQLKKFGKPSIAWSASRYDKHFRREILRNSEALAKLRELKGLAKERDVYLVCKEDSSEYCHRRILLELAEFNLGE